MSVLLARTADRLYWGARYVERAEDTARVVRAYNELVADYPSHELLRWTPLLALAGSGLGVELSPDDPTGETAVVRHVVADTTNPGSIASSVEFARGNLRTTREVMPREAWHAINELAHYTDAMASAAVHRQQRHRFLSRVIEISRRLDGVLESTMARTNPFRMLRLGRLVERADMTTRVLGVTAAAILQVDASNGDELVGDEVRWMNVLRSVSALQMYQRAVRGPIDGASVVRFLLSYSAFPRSVQGCLDELRSVVNGLPGPQSVLAALDEVETALSEGAVGAPAAVELDAAMDRVQIAIAGLDRSIHERYVGSAF